MNLSKKGHFFYWSIIIGIVFLFVAYQPEKFVKNDERAEVEALSSGRSRRVSPDKNYAVETGGELGLSRNALSSEDSPKSALEEDGNFSALRGIKLATFLFEKRASELSESYHEQIKGLQLSDHEQEEIVEQLLNLEKKRLQAQFLLDDLEFQKTAYDRDVRELLGPEKYDAYRKSESDKYHNDYVTDFNNHLLEKNQTRLNEEQENELRELLSIFGGGVTLDRSKGPYGISPRINFSQLEPLAEEYESNEQISLLTGEREYLINKASSPSLKEAVETYYNSLLERY